MSDLSLTVERERGASKRCIKVSSNSRIYPELEFTEPHSFTEMVAKARFSRLLAFLVAACAVTAVPTSPPPRIEFIQIAKPGIVAIEMMVISENLAVFFDRATNDPLQVDNHTAWGALYNMETNTATGLRLTSDTFCATGGWLSNGTMVRP